jgi:hypothetical protein
LLEPLRSKFGVGAASLFGESVGGTLTTFLSGHGLADDFGWLGAGALRGCEGVAGAFIVASSNRPSTPGSCSGGGLTVMRVHDPFSGHDATANRTYIA